MNMSRTLSHHHISTSHSLSSTYPDFYPLHCTNSVIYISRTLFFTSQPASTPPPPHDRLYHFHLPNSILYISPTSTLHELSHPHFIQLTHLHITNSIIYITRTPSFTSHERYHLNLSDSLIYNSSD